jgi:hypothetical protein
VAVMAVIMGVISPYWMKTIDPAVAEINRQSQSAVKAARAQHAAPAQGNIISPAGGQK